jgi:hypothetical protein
VRTRWGSVKYRMPLLHICLCPDAQKNINDLSPVAADVVSIVLCDEEFWPHLKQLTKVIKPLVDAIGMKLVMLHLLIACWNSSAVPSHDSHS